MKWNTKLVKIGVNRMNLNQLLQDFKIKLATLLTVLFFPNNRRICWSNLTEKKIYSSMQHKMQGWCWHQARCLRGMPLDEVLQPASAEMLNTHFLLLPHTSGNQWAKFFQAENFACLQGINALYLFVYATYRKVSSHSCTASGVSARVE